MTTPRIALGLPAPAKVNLFLHVLGRREDGYHEIQSVFVPVDLCDTLDIERRDDGLIVREGDLTGPEQDDLALRAAQALREHAQAAAGSQGARPARTGATIRVEKRIPVGAGLGGGSSDAATTLIALNRLWDLRLSRSDLALLGRGLGADVPFFLGRSAAFVEGVGERCSELALAPAWYCIVYPQVHVSTAEMFSDPKLTRDRKRTTIAGFSAAHPVSNGAIGAGAGFFGSNDLEPVVRGRIAPVDAALRLLGRHGPARMSGSGSAVFCIRPDEAAAQELLERIRGEMPAQWSAWAVPALAELPLAAW